MPNFSVDPALLSLNHRSTESSLLIEVAGDVDLYTSLQLREYLIDAVTTYQNKAVVVDLTRVTFIDSSGLSLLIEARKQLALQSRTLRLLLAPGRQPEQILKLCHFDKVIDLTYALDEITD